MKAYKYFAILVAVYPTNLIAADFGYFLKFGYGGRTFVEHPEFTRSVSGAEGEQADEVVKSDKKKSLSMIYAAGLELNREYGIEYGRINSQEIWESDDYFNGFVDFDYLVVNKSINIDGSTFIKLGIGESHWKTEELIDVGPSDPYKKHASVSGSSPLVQLGVDYCFHSGESSSHDIGLYYYHGFDEDYSHQAVQIAYSFHSW